MRLTLLLAAIAVIPGLAAAAAEIADSDSAPIARGQKGWGLSVFQGDRPERFEVEVVGVLHHNTAELSYVLARLEGQDLETTGVPAGMSGSPVYIDGELIGAVSFSYNFSRGALAGITPIDGMRLLDRLPDLTPSGVPVAAGDRPEVAAPSLDQIRERRFAADGIDRAFARLRPPDAADGRAAVLWQAAGFGDRAVERLRSAVGPLVTAGGIADATAAEDAPLAAGDAVAMLLITGDLALAAHGTVTEVHEGRVFAFGHPVFNLGPTRVPMARSEVVTTVASMASSFKLSNAGAVIGAFVQDREAGARGLIGLDAPMVPITVALRGAAERDYRMRLADVRPLFPTLVGMAAFGALNAGSWSSGEMGIALDARVRIAGHDELHLRQRFDSDNAGIDSVLYLLNVIAYLIGNDLEAARIESIDVVLEQTPEPQVATLVAAHPARRRVAPGDTVDVTLEWQPFRGRPQRYTVTVVIPPDVGDGTYAVMIGDGASVDGALRAVEPTQPRTLGEALDLLGGFASREQLATLGLVAGRGLAVGGSVLPALPTSVRALIAAGSVPATALALRAVDHQLRPAPVPLTGLVRVDFEVERPRH